VKCDYISHSHCVEMNRMTEDI